ncbi:hypothetical protein D3C80_2151700 [compost metagenome]
MGNKAFRTQGFRRFLRRFRLRAVDDNFRAMLRQPFRQQETQTARRAGNQNLFIIQ